MKHLLSSLNPKVLLLIKEIGHEAELLHQKAYVVGGFVRDLFLEEKNLDLDIVVEGDATLLAQILAKKRSSRLTLYKQFMTASLDLPDGSRIDFASARKETYAHPGALPSVSRGLIHDDLFRRDFTINAMAISIDSSHFGLLIDDFNGCQDLKKRKIRILHEKSFMDDPTRILRAVRFEQRLNFHIETQSLRLLKAAIKNDASRYVKAPRYFEEFKKVLEEPHPLKYLKRLDALNGFHFIKRNFKLTQSILKQLRAVEQNVLWFKDQSYESIPLEEWLVYFMVIISRMKDKELQLISERFNLKKEEKQKILSSKRISKILIEISSAQLPASEIYQVLKSMSMEELVLLTTQTKSARVHKRIENFLKCDKTVQLEINGQDLKSLGVKPGQRMGQLLQRLLSEKLDRKIFNRAQEINLAKKLLSTTFTETF